MARTREIGSASRSVFRVGDWLIEKSQLSISAGARTSCLEPRVMELLVYLAERPGEIISTEQLLNDIWHGSFYGDGPVQRAMALLRRNLGDDAQAPRYIETIRKRGYRLIAPVVFPDDYLSAARASGASWNDSSPFVGLRAFDAEHSSVFFGRGRSIAQLLEAVQRQWHNGSRLLLVVGPSGCGKTSLLHAGVLPLLTRTEGFDGLHAASLALLDFAQGPSSDALSQLAQALCTWQLDRRPVFVDSEALTEQLRIAPEVAPKHIDSAFGRWTRRSNQARPFLLLLVDHLEAILIGSERDSEVLNEALIALCACEHVVLVLLCRSDFYPALLKHLPGVALLKAPDGHFDLLPPSAGELAEIIRRPALAAGLSYERRSDSMLGLDDALRDAAIAHPEALPMLQYTLQSLYEARTDGYMLSFAAYEQLGGLGGALASRAERVFSVLPEAVQAAWTPVFERLVVSHESNQALTARRLPWSELRTAQEIELVQRLVEARLFTSALDAGTAYFSVTHETLLRAWPRVQEWARENQRHLQTQQRVRHATRRWIQANRRSDLLLNHGLPLLEARDLLKHAPRLLDVDDCDMVRASEAAHRRRRLRRLLAVAGALLLAAASTISALLALRAHKDAERRRGQAESLVDYLLTDLADELRPLGRLSLMDQVAQRALEYLSSLPERDVDQNASVQRARALRTLGEVFVDRGNHSAAERAFYQAQTFLDEALIGVNASSTALLERGILAYWRGMLAFQQSALDDAEQHFELYRAVANELLRREPNNPDWELELSYALNNLGSVAQRRQQTNEALVLFKQSVALKDRVLAARPADTRLAVDQADSLSWIGSVLDQQGRLVEALEYYARQIEVLRGIGARTPSADGWRHLLAKAELIMADLQLALGNVHGSRTLYRSAENTLAQLVAADASNTTWHYNLSFAQAQIAYLLLMDNQPKTALDYLQLAEQRLHPLLLDKQVPTDWRKLSVQIALRSAQAGIATGLMQKSSRHLDEAIAGAQALLDQNAEDNDTRILQARILLIHGDLLGAQQHLDRARTKWQEARSLLVPAAALSTDRRMLQPWIMVNQRLDLIADSAPAQARLARSGYRLSMLVPP